MNSMHMRWPFASVIAVASYFVLTAGLIGQQAARTVWDGVYSPAQAERGGGVYKEKCANCHGAQLTGRDAPPLVGSEFSGIYNGSPLYALFDRIQGSMPADAIGSLTRQQVVDIIAAMLRAAEMPAGTSELPTSSDGLQGITYLGVKPSGASAAPSGAASPQRAATAVPVLYEGARLIIGDSSAPIESGAFVVANGQITSIGPKNAVTAPAGAARVDLTGKTVIPALVNAHVHIGYEGYTTWGAQNYTAANVLDHLQREAFYGVGATTSVGSSPTDPSLQFQQDQAAGKFPAASRFFFMPGMAPPNGGPDAILMRGTSVLHAVNEVSTAADARAAVQTMAAKGIRHVKIWVDDRRGTYPKMTPEVYNAIISEAHARQMIVHAHAIALADQKAVVSAGADVLVHMVQTEPLDEEYLGILRAKKPYWATVIGFGDRSEVCNNDPFVDQMYSAAVLATIRAASCGAVSPNAAARETRMTENFQKMIANGARLVLGTDAGIASRHSFGWADHHELAHWIELGLTPAQAIVAATSRPAELLGIKDMGTLAVGKSADFVVLTANPLDNIRNTRQIASVYLRGAALDRDALAAAWKNSSRQ